MSKQPPPITNTQKACLSEEEMAKLAIKTVQEFVNACRCKNDDDVLLALSFLLRVGIEVGELVKHGEKVMLQ